MGLDAIVPETPGTMDKSAIMSPTKGSRSICSPARLAAPLPDMRFRAGRLY